MEKVTGEIPRQKKIDGVEALAALKALPIETDFDRPADALGNRYEL